MSALLCSPKVTKQSVKKMKDSARQLGIKFGTRSWVSLSALHAESGKTIMESDTDWKRELGGFTSLRAPNIAYDLRTHSIESRA
mmetsp:Transcript_6151/g.8661  ORF Transcript_6151/g.8661 Transcript_6151/m.8661 type:complete len:84 (-) Transcript_6151:574-825(-)